MTGPDAPGPAWNTVSHSAAPGPAAGGGRRPGPGPGGYLALNGVTVPFQVHGSELRSLLGVKPGPPAAGRAGPAARRAAPPAACPGDRGPAIRLPAAYGPTRDSQSQ